MPEVMIAELSDGAGGTATFYLTYDGSLKVTRFRCDNPSGARAFGELVQQVGDGERDGLKVATTFQPGSDTLVPVTTVWADRLQLVREPDGDLVGIDMNLGIDESPGLAARAAGGLPSSVRGPVRVPASKAP